MKKISYSPDLCKQLYTTANDPSLKIKHRRVRYEAGEELHLRITGVHPAVEGDAVLQVEKFLGGGFAGQVYRCRISSLTFIGGESIDGLRTGLQVAVKIIIPASPFAQWFRNIVFWLAFQGPFSAQVNRGACRSGLIMQKLIRRAAKQRFGHETAVKDAYASFYDPSMRSYGEITEWIEGRMWLLESDDRLAGRSSWRSIPLEETGSPEYIAKRRFMSGMVDLMHDMGAPEFARQYEWWTMKSQPNVMKRTDLADADGPGDGLCAIDFRAGLALLPFLPMSPGDIKLILAGLFRRGTWVQFDRCNTQQLRAFIARNADLFDDMQPALDEFFEQDLAYRRSLPDVTHHGFRLLRDPALRSDVRSGLIEGWMANELVDEPFAVSLRAGGPRFILFYLLGAIPLAGRLLRKRMGNAAYRKHIAGIFTSAPYRRVALRAHAAQGLAGWHRNGRVDERHVAFLLNHPLLFLIEQVTLGFLPITLHRVILRPSRIPARIAAGWIFLRNFLSRPDFREAWFLNELEQGEADGMLQSDERLLLQKMVKDPFIVRYLKCLGVHFATLPITQIISLLTAALWAIWLYANGNGWGDAVGAFFLTLALFQVMPISPGSFCRGGFVVFLMIKERNLRDYLIAAPVSFLKYIGYLAFPLQMTTAYPQLSRFMAARWATNMVHVIPVFGEKGALFEHAVFDTFFNRPRRFARRIAPRLHLLLTLWMALGLTLLTWLTTVFTPDFRSPRGFNLLLGIVVIFLLPRLLFYPLIRRKPPRAKETIA